MHEQHIAERRKLDERCLGGVASPFEISAQCQPTVLIDAQDRHRNALVRAGDAVLLQAGGR
jgi:hypothetical protein